jgi:prevent-host-death family protein
MRTINMLDAKSQLSKLVQAVEDGEESEIIIARNGRPAARLVPVEATRPVGRRRLGIAKGRFTIPDDFDADNELIARLFNGEDD